MAGNDNLYPSVQVVERPFQAGQHSDATVAAFGAFVGRADQGPTVPTEVRSWNEFARVFGTNYTDLHYAVNDFFTNGGRRAFVVRVEGANAAAAELDVFDSTVTEPGGSDTPLFTVTAANPGTWGNRLHLVTAIRDAAAHRFDVALFSVPTGVTFDPSRRNSEYVLDMWQDVTLDPNDPRYLYAVVNRPSSTGSPHVVFSGQSYAPDATEFPLPGDGGGTAFTGGVAGSYTAPYDPDAAYAAAIDKLSAIPGPYVLNLPGMTTASIVRSAIQDAESRGDVFVVVDTPVGQSPAEAITYTETDLGLSTLSTRTPSFAAVYYPWVSMPAIGSAVGGRTTLRAPGGAIVGAFMATDEREGVWRAPAGVRVGLAGAVDTARDLSESELELLNEAHVNALRKIPGRGVCIMGTRTLKKYGIDRTVPVRRSLIDIQENLKRLTEFALFEPNDERLWSEVTGVVDRFLGEFWQRGGLKGATSADAYVIRCDQTNNTPATIEQGYVNIEVGVALAQPAEFVTITIGHFEGRTTSEVTV